MAYAILRTKKLKTMGAIAGSAQHTYREKPTPNADWRKLLDNAHTGAKSSAGLLKKFREAMPEKVRKNAVLGVEYLITASPERFNDDDFNHERYFRDSLRWLQEKHGKDNVLAASVHMDEKTPHLVAYVIPKDDKGKLNCRAFLGGRSKLSAMQTDFSKQVGQKHGLRRGIKGSKAKHKTIKQFYSELNQAAREGIKNRPGIRDRFFSAFGFQTERLKAYERSAELQAAVALEARLDARRARQEVDIQKQELEKLASELGTKEEQLEAQERELRAEQVQLAEEEEAVKEAMKIAGEGASEANEYREQLKAAETLSNELKRKLDETQRELHEERLNNRSGDDMGLNR